MATTQPQQEWFEKDYYKVLGVSSDADAKEITKAHRRLARENHPDLHPGDAAAEERFKEVSAAYDVLGDAEKRKAYDEVRRLGPGGFGPMGGQNGAGFGAGFDDAGSFGDILGNLFGRRGRTPPTSGARRGRDQEASITIGFADAVRGLTTKLALTGEASCSTCNGTGARPGTAPTVCATCHGRGAVDDNQGLFSLSSMCPSCGGRGKTISDPCPTCSGSGTERRRREVNVRLPAGVSDGQRVRLKGKGGPGSNGGPPGDLFVVVSVGTHDLFGRKGRDLTVTVPVTFTEAALGADIDVPTLDGGSVTIRVPPGASSGKVFRLSGRGVAAEGDKKAGDLLVTVEVVVPTNLNRAQRKAIEALDDVFDEDPRRHLT